MTFDQLKALVNAKTITMFAGYWDLKGGPENAMNVIKQQFSRGVTIL